MEIDIKSLNSYSDFEKLCNGLKTREEFKQKYGIKVLNRFYTLKRYGKIQNNMEFPLPKTNKKGLKKNNYSEFNSIDKYNKHICDNSYNNPTEFLEKEPRLYQKMCRDGLADKVIYPNRQRNTLVIETIEELQTLVTNENISSKTDLGNRYPGIRAKFSEELNKIRFSKLLAESLDEAKFMKELFKYGINFKYQYSFDNSHYRYDFLINSKFIIEIHGRQHFNDEIAKDAWNKDVCIQEADKLKYKFAKDNGVEVYYFTYCISDYNKFGYFTKVYTNIINLFTDLGLDITNIDSDYENKYNNSISFEYNQDLVLIDLNKFIKENKIYTREELKKIRPDLYWKAVKFELRNKLDFCSWWTLDDVKIFKQEHKITENKEFYNKFKDIYKYCKENNML